IYATRTIQVNAEEDAGGCRDRVSRRTDRSAAYRAPRLRRTDRVPRLAGLARALQRKLALDDGADSARRALPRVGSDAEIVVRHTHRPVRVPCGRPQVHGHS